METLELQEVRVEAVGNGVEVLAGECLEGEIDSLLRNFYKNYFFTLSYEGKKVFVRGGEVVMNKFMIIYKNDCITSYRIKNVLKHFLESKKEVGILPLTS